MEFRTPIHIEPLKFRIGYETPGLLLGSCFAGHIGLRMERYKLPVVVNPFGVLFNPASVARCLNRLADATPYEAKDLIRSGERWVSLDHHGSLASGDRDETLRRVNRAVADGAEALRRAEYVILTLGTAWVYEYGDDRRIVANCHKLPATAFNRRRLTAEETVTLLGEAIERTLAGKRVILTVSPVRHLGDGLTGNALSKATLVVAAHELCERYARCDYFPSFEILTDDLRDYRFYDRDMCHPSETAIDYVWEKFRDAALSDVARTLFGPLDEIARALSHRPSDTESAAYRAFRLRYAEKVRTLQQQYPNLDLNCELQFFES